MPLVVLVLVFGLCVVAEMRIRTKDKEIKGLVDEKKALQKSLADQQSLVESANIKYNDLKSLQTYIDNSVQYVVLNLRGDIIHISEQLRRILELQKDTSEINFVDNVTANEGQQQFISELINMPRSQIWDREVQITTKSGTQYWFQMSIIPQVQQGRTPTVLLICQDITAYIAAKKDIDESSRLNLEKEIQLQRSIAFQVIQAQEVERERIGKDMHDGIGQILTALKFNIESINLAKPEKAKKKIELIKQIAGDIIKRVREVTFNLRPPELGDYGLDKGLAKLAEGVSAFTGKEVNYENKSGFSLRLAPEVETNLYRMTQEAVNNSVKYAESNFISITLNHSKDMLSIKVVDDGKGFDTSVDSSQNAISGGMGLSSMKERAKYVNGRIFVNSSPGNGSKITINVPLVSALKEERV